MTAIDDLIAALRTDMDQLLQLADLEDNRNRQAAVRLAVKVIRRTVDKFAVVEEEPAPTAWPDAWDDFATCSKCGRRNAPSLATTQGGLTCHPKCPPQTVLYTVKGAPDFDDIVIEAPVGITNPGLVATHLQERLTVLTRPLIDAEHGIDWLVLLKEDHIGAPDAFASLSIDGAPGVRYPLIEAPRGGAL